MNSESISKYFKHHYMNFILCSYAVWMCKYLKHSWLDFSLMHRANEEFEGMRKSNEQEMTKMAALLKKAEMKIMSLQDSFDRKTRENQELTQLCDDLINKVGTSHWGRATAARSCWSCVTLFRGWDEINNEVPYLLLQGWWGEALCGSKGVASGLIFFPYEVVAVEVLWL